MFIEYQLHIWFHLILCDGDGNEREVMPIITNERRNQDLNPVLAEAHAFCNLYYTVQQLWPLWSYSAKIACDKNLRDHKDRNYSQGEWSGQFFSLRSLANKIFFLHVCFHIIHSYYSGDVQKGPPCPGCMLLSRKKQLAGIFFFSYGFVNFWKPSSHFFITLSIVRFGGLETNEHLLEKHNVMQHLFTLESFKRGQ